MTADYDSKEYLKSVDAWWRAANYLSVGQLFLLKNPLLKEELTADDVKIKPVGHWGTIAPQNFIYAHLNRVIKKYDLNMFYIEGSGHGGQVMVSNSYLDGSYSEIYPEISQDEAGMTKLFKRFSFPGGVASHAAPETPGSIHEGGELGYTLSHATGAILDNPDVIAAAEIGDGEAETGPLAAGWFSNRFINPVKDGAVLPILQVNGFKISNPTITARMSDEELTKYFEGMGWKPYFVSTFKGGRFDGMKDIDQIHEEMVKTLDAIIEDIKAIQKNARENGDESFAHWPILIFQCPKGWTGPKADLDGNPIENSFRAHQIPLPVDQKHMNHKELLLDWLKSYKPEELKAFCLTGMSRKERLHAIVQSMDKFYYQYGGIQLVVIDGIADLVKSANDEAESIAIVDEVYRLAGIYKTCIICVLHFVPNGIKLRGHIGSELQRKAAAILSIEKDENPAYSVVKAIKVRDGSPLDVPMLLFTWDKQKDMHVSAGEKPAEDKEKRKKEELQGIIKEIFRSRKKITYTELVTELMQAMDIKERTAKSYIIYMKTNGMLNQDSSNNYQP